MFWVLLAQQNRVGCVKVMVMPLASTIYLVEHFIKTQTSAPVMYVYTTFSKHLTILPMLVHSVEGVLFVIALMLNLAQNLSK